MLFGKAFDLLLPLFRANRFRPDAGEIGVVDRANLLLFQGAFDFVSQLAHTDEREWVTSEDITRRQLPVNRTSVPTAEILSVQCRDGERLFPESRDHRPD
jgi:hypothetical protein